MDEGTLLSLHGLKSEPFLIVGSGKDSELALLRLAPLWVRCEEVESLGGERNVVASLYVRGLVDIQGHGQPAVAFQSCALLGAR